MGEWRDIETAPKEPVPILVAYDDGSVEMVEDSSEYNWQPYKGKKPRVQAPTHWMPLPKPPTQKGEG